jgi:hypothetical protein
MKLSRIVAKIGSVDTITTKLLVLVLFVTIIPLMAVANYSIDIIISKSSYGNAK